MTKILGKVRAVRLEIEDHGILTCMVMIDREDGGTQGFGGFSLDAYDKTLKRRVGTAAGMDWILRLLQTFGVRSLEAIVGQPIYAIYLNDEFNSVIEGLETPGFNGKRQFLISDWRAQWSASTKDSK